MEIQLVYLLAGLLILLIVGFFALPIIPSLDYSNQINTDVQFTEKEYVTKTQKVVSETIHLGAVTFKTIDFSLPQGQTTKVQWSSTKRVSLFAVMKQSIYDNFYKTIILTMGVASATAVLTDGLSIPLITSQVIPRLPNLLNHLGSVPYYALNSIGAIKTMNLEAGPHKIVVFDVHARAGSSTINLTYEYQVLEDVIKHRTETHYPPNRITIFNSLLAKNYEKTARINSGTSS